MNRFTWDLRQQGAIAPRVAQEGGDLRCVPTPRRHPLRVEPDQFLPDGRQPRLQQAHRLRGLLAQSLDLFLP